MAILRPSEWLERFVKATFVYEHKSLAESYMQDTGHEAPWSPVKASVENKTVGNPKGLLEPISDENMDVVSGVDVAEAVVCELCTHITFTVCQESKDRFAAAVADLKRQGF